MIAQVLTRHARRTMSIDLGFLLSSLKVVMDVPEPLLKAVKTRYVFMDSMDIVGVAEASKLLADLGIPVEDVAAVRKLLEAGPAAAVAGPAEVQRSRPCLAQLFVLIPWGA